MLHDYDNPNTCYAIGDSFSIMMGTATTVRQPSAGVFEEVSALVKSGGSDAILHYDGSNSVRIMDYDLQTGEVAGATNATPPYSYYNLAWKIGNGVYIQKSGSTDRVAVSGVQVDA